MAQSNTVNLPREHKARFPDSCVVCGQECPNSTVTLITGSIGWWTWILWAFGWPVVVKAPACRGCSWRLQGARFVSLAVTVGIACVALFLIWPMLPDVLPKRLRKWAMMGLALVCLLPQIMYEVFFARPFEITAYAKSIDYEFTDFDLAFAFALFNLDSGDVKVNGHSFPTALLAVDKADETEDSPGKDD